MIHMDKKKILIVEDEDVQAKAMEMKLTDRHELMIAKDGDEGLKMALKEHPDLIILDLVMPKMDGFMMFEELRKDNWGATVKVLVLTNLSNREEDFINKGDVEYIEKTDISLQKLGEKVEKMLGA